MTFKHYGEEQGVDLLHTYFYVREGGGAAGYLWHLKQALNRRGSWSDVSIMVDVAYSAAELFPAIRPSSAESDRTRVVSWPAVVLGGMLKKHTRRLPHVPEFWSSAKVFVAHTFDFALTLFRTKGFQPKEPSALFLMPHAPTDEAEETLKRWLAGRAGSLQAFLGTTAWWLLAIQQLRLLKRVRGLIVPYKQCLDAYFVRSALLRQRFESWLARSALYEVPPGVLPLPEPKINSAQARRFYGLPSDKIIVGFVGRYHTDKGFPLFRQIVEISDKQDDQFFFVSIGNGPESKPMSKKYKDLGWLNRGILSQALSAVDIFLFPNRVAYMDLALLEVMAMSKPVIAAYVGGHRRLNAPGIVRVFKMDADWWYKVLREHTASQYHLKSMGEKNRICFQSEYTIEAWIDRHCQLARELTAMSLSM